MSRVKLNCFHFPNQPNLPISRLAIWDRNRRRPKNTSDGAEFTWWRHQMETFSALLAILRGIHRSPVNSPHKGQWRGALMFSFICVWINGWVNNREAGDLRRHCAQYDVTVMTHWDPDEIIVFIQTTFSQPSTWIKIIAFWFKLTGMSIIRVDNKSASVQKMGLHRKS